MSSRKQKEQKNALPAPVASPAPACTPTGDDLQRYVLVAHRALPKEQRPVISYHLPSFRDGMRARLAVSGDEEELQTLTFPAARAARCLESVTNTDKHPEFKGPMPAAGPDRVAWVFRWPVGWIVELARQVDSKSDLDPEEE